MLRFNAGGEASFGRNSVLTNMFAYFKDLQASTNVRLFYATYAKRSGAMMWSGPCVVPSRE